MANEKIDLIDRNALLVANMYGNTAPITHRTYAENLIQKAPTVDAVEVVHGRWMNVIDYGGFCVGFCSVCDADQKAQNYTALRAHHRHCRWCGARMDGDGNGSV